MAEPKSIKLAKKISTILKGEEFDDCVSALKIARTLLPAKSKSKKDREDAEEQEANEGALVPADAQLMEFSKAMGNTVPVVDADKDESAVME